MLTEDFMPAVDV